MKYIIEKYNWIYNIFRSHFQRIHIWDDDNQDAQDGEIGQWVNCKHKKASSNPQS